jgi:ubiquinol-cytochrome c reductase iron-sulfur subunit
MTQRPGSLGSPTTPTNQHGSADFDVDDPAATRFDLVREGARRDGVEIVHYQPRFPVAGSKVEKRVERAIAGLLALTGISALAFIVIYVAWPYEYTVRPELSRLYTPLLGLTMALTLFGIGGAVIMFAKRLLPEEVSVQDRHDGASTHDERVLTGATMLSLADDTGIKRRPLLKGALAVGLLPVGAMAVVPLGGLIKKPGNALTTTAWKDGLRLTREDGTPVKPEELLPGSIETVFPGIDRGATNAHADSPTLLIHLREADAVETVGQIPGANYGGYYAYSKVCTHAGCPASLYEQQTNRLLCPCHQSQFDVKNGCTPVFGPAARPLPQLAITVDSDGYFIAKGDYSQPIGPSFWERRS